MELEKLLVKIEADADTASIEEMQEAVKELEAEFKRLATISSNGKTVGKNLLGDDYAQTMSKLSSTIETLKTNIKSMESMEVNPLSSMQESMKSLSGGGLSSLLGGISKISLALMGVRGVFTAIRKAMSSYLAQNEELQNKLDSLWLALGTAFAPVLETLVNLAIKLVSYINVFVQALGFAGINLNRLNNTASNIKKSLAGFDEINNLNKDGSVSNFVNPFQDVELNEEWVEFLQDIADMLLYVRDIIVDILDIVDIGLGGIQSAIDWVLDGITEGIDWLQATIMESELPDWIKSSLYSVLEYFKSIINNMKNLVNGIFTSIRLVLSGVINLLKGNFKLGIKQVINGIITMVESCINFVINGINRVLEPLSRLGNKVLEFLGIGGFNFTPISKVALPRLATGTNYVPQDMIAQLHEGEAVVPKKYNPYDMYGNVSAEQLNLLTSINDYLSQINNKNFNVDLDGESITNKVNKMNQKSTKLNGTSVFALDR